jgi:hypothetical protein
MQDVAPIQVETFPNRSGAHKLRSKEPIRKASVVPSPKTLTPPIPRRRQMTRKPRRSKPSNIGKARNQTTTTCFRPQTSTPALARQRGTMTARPIMSSFKCSAANAVAGSPLPRYPGIGRPPEVDARGSYYDRSLNGVSRMSRRMLLHFLACCSSVCRSMKSRSRIRKKSFLAGLAVAMFDALRERVR